jgi:hypothetical protein
MFGSRSGPWTIANPAVKTAVLTVTAYMELEEISPLFFFLHFNIS